MQNAKATALRAMHNTPPILLLANAWDAASARLFEQAGARAIATTSAGIAFSQGFPDGEHISRSQMLDAVARIALSVEVPVTADVEAGYGTTPEDAAVTAQQVIEAGAVGMNFEDARTDAAHALFSVEQQVARIHAICDAGRRAGVPLVLNARTDVYLGEVGDPSGRFAETVRRLNAYREAGADCLFVPGVSDGATIARLVREVSGPINVLVSAGLPPASELERLGVARVSVGSGIMRATLATARDAAKEFFDQGTFSSVLENTVAYREINSLMTKKLS